MIRSGVAFACAASLLISGCVARPVAESGSGGKQSTRYFPQSLEKDVDILFLVDNSPSMLGEQTNLANNFRKLIEALRSDKLGSDGSGRPCTETDKSGCIIPNVHIGVISPNLGAGPYSQLVGGGCTVEGGDGGVLQATPRRTGCVPPDDSWISHIDGVTNISGSTATDPVEQVVEAFECIAELGGDGCGFEHQLEAAKLALTEGTNPGFIREDALLAVVFITDEDDCSASNYDLFDTNTRPDLGDPNFRCFQYGVTCASTPPDEEREPGVRTGCDPEEGWLQSVVGGENSYEAFFKSLKPIPGRVILAAIAGPTAPVEVETGTDQGGREIPILQASCAIDENDKSTGAFPAIRIKALLDSFDDPIAGHTPGLFQEICTDDFGPAMKSLGDKIIANLGTQCITAPLLRSDGGLACFGDDELGNGVTCPSNGCLSDADCKVVERVATSATEQQTRDIEACPAGLFEQPSDNDCGATCPCWRIVPRTGCEVASDGTGSPYGFEILREGNAEAPPNTTAVVSCKTTTEKWGSSELFTLLDEDEDGSPERICQ